MEHPEILHLYTEEKLSYRQIAHRIGIPYPRVRAIVVAAGVSRTRSGCKQGSLNPSWKGGLFVDAKGYRHVYRPEHPHANGHGYILEHRLVVEEILGRLLEPGEIVHHRDHNPGNNAPENLELMTHAAHGRFHGLEKGRSTHCKRNHERTAENTYVTPTGDFQCRICRRSRSRGRIRTYEKRAEPAMPRIPATHCKRGHEFTAANTIVTPDRRRQCRECQRTRNREWMRAHYRKPSS